MLAELLPGMLRPLAARPAQSRCSETWRTARFRIDGPGRTSASTGLGRLSDHDLDRRAAPGADMAFGRSGCTTKMPNCSVANSFSQLSSDRLEDRRGIGDRAADDAQHLGRRRLLRQRFLRLVEQPRVLDRDHGLVGEGLQQLRRAAGANVPGFARVTTDRRRSPVPRSSAARTACCDSRAARASLRRPLVGRSSMSGDLIRLLARAAPAEVRDGRSIGMG